MKAILCEQFGSPESLVLRDIPTPEPGADEVLIAVHAASVNFPDTLIIQGKYQYQPNFPFSPGCEVAGDIIALGTNVKDLEIGDRVVAFPGWGGFAEYVAVNQSVVSRLADEVDYAHGAAFLLTYATSYYALQDRASLKPNETVLILGAGGGVGMAAVDLAKTMGARAIAAASSAEKLAVCEQYGADELINYSATDIKTRVRELTDGRGVDVIYDAVGGSYSEPALRTMAWNGRFLVVGFASGEIPKMPLNLMLLKNCAVSGVFWGEFARREPEKNRKNMALLMDWLKMGKIQPYISARYGLKDVSCALQDMLDRKVLGKLIIEFI